MRHGIKVHSLHTFSPAGQELGCIFQVDGERVGHHRSLRLGEGQGPLGLESAAAGQNRISRKEMLLLPQKLGGNSKDKSLASLRLLFSKVSTVGD